MFLFIWCYLFSHWSFGCLIHCVDRIFLVTSSSLTSTCCPFRISFYILSSSNVRKQKEKWQHRHTIRTCILSIYPIVSHICCEIFHALIRFVLLSRRKNKNEKKSGNNLRSGASIFNERQCANNTCSNCQNQQREVRIM